MTVTSQDLHIQHPADGVQTVFPYNFRIDEADWMVVYIDSTLQQSGYTVDGVGEQSGGNVTFGIAPPDGTTVSLFRLVPTTQEIDYQPYDAFPAEVNEQGLDKLTMQTMQAKESNARAVRLPLYELPDSYNTVLPPLDVRKNQVLGFDGFGNVIAVAGTGGGTSVHGSLSGLGNDDHSQYYNTARGDSRYSLTTHGHPNAVPSGPAGFMSGADKTKLNQMTNDHGLLGGLGDDDHVQYHTDSRGDVRYLKLSGGNLTGQLGLPGGGTGLQALQATEITAAIDGAIVVHVGLPDPHAQYLQIADGDARYVEVGGDTMTGPLVLPADPTAANQAATKSYVDTFIGSVITVNITSNATGDAEATVHEGWNAQANAGGITRGANELIYYRWPSSSQDVYRYVGNQLAGPWTSTAADWVQSAGLSEAPQDGTMYGRINATWARSLALAGGTMTGQITLVGGGAGLNAISVSEASSLDTAAIAAHVGLADPHTQYLQESQADLVYARLDGATFTGQISLPGGGSGVQAATVAEIDSKDAAAISAHVGQSDPHTQYLMSTTADGRYLQLSGGTMTGATSVPASGTGTQTIQAAEVDAKDVATINAHTGAGDPHPQYMTPAEADGTYIPLSQKGAVNGVATLNDAGHVPDSQLPGSSGGGSPLGTIAWFHAVPAGWLQCNGQQVTKNGYPNLWIYAQGYLTTDQVANPGLFLDFDPTFFNLPNLSGQFMRGLGGNSSGLGIQQDEIVGPHSHTYQDPTHQHTQTANDTGSDQQQTASGPGAGNGYATALQSGSSIFNRPASINITIDAYPGAENIPANVALIPCMQASNIITEIPGGTVPVDSVNTDAIIDGNVTAAKLAPDVLLTLLYPVGSIYISADNVNPGVRFGGTWIQQAAGRVLIGAGTLGSDTYAAGVEGGEATHILAEGEMPSHGHSGFTGNQSANHTHPLDSALPGSQSFARFNGQGGAFLDQGVSGSNQRGSHTSINDVNHTHTIAAQGGGAAHENRQPYRAVYFWERTA